MEAKFHSERFEMDIAGGSKKVWFYAITELCNAWRWDFFHKSKEASFSKTIGWTKTGVGTLKTGEEFLHKAVTESFLDETQRIVTMISYETFFSVDGRFRSLTQVFFELCSGNFRLEETNSNLIDYPLHGRFLRGVGSVEIATETIFFAFRRVAPQWADFQVLFRIR